MQQNMKNNANQNRAIPEVSIQGLILIMYYLSLFNLS
jgi:hypothetical protein